MLLKTTCRWWRSGGLWAHPIITNYIIIREYLRLCFIYIYIYALLLQVPFLNEEFIAVALVGESVDR